ncbi:UNVERIFIED_CONTAM: hypothetical protein GTU68_019781 [Idotea baltica]|nr:hypothetical protein [Idotea baltica]
MSKFSEEVISWFKNLQDEICQGLETEDGKASFHEDLWEREGGGGGRTRVIQNGNVIEKGGVNFSAVTGQLPKKIANAIKVKAGNFLATGVSIVIHPNNPHVPIIHMNVRFFELEDGTYWFGGGIDLTPHYVVKSDAQFFHQQLKNTCDEADVNFYPKFKKWADDYFFIKHRNETRGVGGIFFDRLTGNTEAEKQHFWAFVQNVGKTFLPTYLQLIKNNKNKTFTEHEQLWQKVRRGRYVEFNLVYDKGTKFGLDTAGRIESILMSLPPQVEWHYDFKVEEGSPEQITQTLLTKEINWA